MSTNLQVEARDSGKIAIPSRILIDTLKTLPEQPVTFTINKENHAIEISAGDGKYKLAGEDGDDFPKIPVLENASSISLRADVLIDVLHKDLRRSRSATMSQYPTQTGAAGAVGLVLPYLTRQPDVLAQIVTAPWMEKVCK